MEAIKEQASYITGVSAGTHSVYVRAYDNAGNYRQSNTISVTTNVAPNTPSVSLYSRSTTFTTNTSKSDRFK